MRNKHEEMQSLKDLMFRGAFFVILIYVLVFIYNSGILNRGSKNTPPSNGNQESTMSNK